MSAVVADAEETKIIRDLALRIDERRRKVYGPGGEDTGWPVLILGVIALALLILIIGIFIIGFSVFGHRKNQKINIFSHSDVIKITPKVIEETTLPIEDKKE
jgi:hypothetical protein